MSHIPLMDNISRTIWDMSCHSNQCSLDRAEVQLRDALTSDCVSLSRVFLPADGKGPKTYLWFRSPELVSRGPSCYSWRACETVCRAVRLSAVSHQTWNHPTIWKNLVNFSDFTANHLLPSNQTSASTALITSPSNSCKKSILFYYQLSALLPS